MHGSLKNEERSIKDLDLKGRRVLIRVDFNVPIKNGTIGDDTRIRSSLPTIQYALEHGRADGRSCARTSGGRRASPIRESSLKPVADHLSTLLKRPVVFAEDCVGEPAKQAIERAGDGGVVLLENLRFHAEEEKNDPAFAARARGAGRRLRQRRVRLGAPRARVDRRAWSATSRRRRPGC